MSGTKTLINIGISIAVIVVIYFGYRFLVKPALDQESASLEPAGFATGNFGSQTDEFLTLLYDLERIQFDNRDKVFAALLNFVDYSQPLDPQTPGRINPFAPIGEGGAPVSATSTAPEGPLF